MKPLCRLTCLPILLCVTGVVTTSCRTIRTKSATPLATPIPDPDTGTMAPLGAAGAWSANERGAHSSFYYMVGEDKFLRGNYAQARDLFGAAYELTPNSFLAAKLLEVEIVRGNASKSANLAKKFSLLYPKSARIRALNGNVLMASGKLEDAVSEFNAAINLGAQQDGAYIQILRIKLSQKQSKEAIDVVKNWVKNVPGSADAHFEMAKIFLIQKDKVNAMHHADIASRLDPERPEFMLLAALTFEMNNESKRAVEQYEKLYRMNSDNERLLAHMAGLYRQLGEPSDALEILDELLQKAKGESRNEIAVQRAIILWELGRHEEASKTFVELYKNNKTSKRLQYLAGLGYEKLNNLPQAMSLYSDLEKSPDYYKPARIRRAVILDQQKKFKEAIDLIKDLQSHDTKPDPELSVFLAEFYSDAGEYQQAINSMREAIKLQPQSATYMFFLGVYQEKSGDTKACVKTMHEVIKLDARYSAAYNYIAYIYAEAGEKLEEAKALAERALMIKPKDGLYLDTLGWIYFKMKNYAKARQYLSEALAVQPNEGVIVAHLADLFLAMGQKDKALTLFQKSLQMRLDDADRAKIQKQMEAAGGRA